ncbi:hypothetical protein TNCV_3555611 [Trichonephila clavipes]|nr:hypothetical protein TNCV_3555611 [Trichonephila clavipes]
MFQGVRAANKLPSHRVLSTNGNQGSHPTSGFFLPTSDGSKTAPVTMLLYHMLPTNQETTLSHKGPSTSGHNQHLRYETEEHVVHPTMGPE